VPLETNIKEEPTSAVKAEIVAVEPATKEPAAKQPAEIVVETLITAETEVTKDQTEAPKDSETVKIIEKKETSNVTKTDDVPLETNIKEEPTSAVKAEIVAVEPATKEPAAKQPAEIVVETLITAETEITKDEIASIEVSTGKASEIEIENTKVEATEKQDENLPNNTDPAPYEEKVIEYTADKNEIIDQENTENQSKPATTGSDKNEECKAFDNTADDKIEEDISKENSSEEIKQVDEIISKDEEPNKIKTEESEVTTSEDVQKQKIDISKAEELIKVEETPDGPTNDNLDLMGNDNIETKPESTLLATLVDDVCEIKKDDDNPTSSILDLQNENIKNAENAESTPGKTNVDVSHIDFEPTGIETIGKEDLLFLDDCKKQNETENKNMDVAVDNLLEF